MADLQRFLDAQNPVYEQVRQELRAGRKRSHWMWFIFPQLAGLGRSATAHHYAMADAEHARAYLTHPVLGERLRECVGLVNLHRDRTAAQIFGFPDVLKLHSCLSLFHAIAPAEEAFTAALERFYGGASDEATLRLLAAR
jgi:uncharacterized protein (DUF1810 family)